MQPTHIFLALFLVAIWGFNFIFVQISLTEMSALLLCVLRFFFASVPAIFFIKIPAVSWRLLVPYGFFTFALQFIFIFAGMQEGVPAGLAGLLAQVQVFFSFFFAAIFLKERITKWQLTGAIIAFWGISVVYKHTGGEVSLVGFLFILIGAMSWGIGSVLAKKIGSANAMGLVIWGSFIAFFPLFALCVAHEGLQHMKDMVGHLSIKTWLAVGYVVYASTWFGYGVWNWLLGRYFIGTVLPFTFLIPVFAMLGSMFVFHEPLQPWKMLAGLLIVFGLCINLFGARAAVWLSARYLGGNK
jgi:O-acetylserine/cysteine efflux transporter